MVLLNSRDLAMNPEAFNLMREQAITNDSNKLLRLAVALKAEIESSSGQEPRADAMAKAREIEKLARDVKSRMTIDPM